MMRNKVLVINADTSSISIEDTINQELNKGWLIELFYEARGTSSNKIIVTLYREDEKVTINKENK